MTRHRQQLSIIAIAILFLFFVSYNIHQDVRARRLSYLPTHMHPEKYTPASFQDAIEDSTTEYYEHLRAQLDDLIKAGAKGTPPSDDSPAAESSLAAVEYSEGQDDSSQNDNNEDDDNKEDGSKKDDSTKDDSSVDDLDDLLELIEGDTEPSATEPPMIEPYMTEIFGIDPIMTEIFGIQPPTTESSEEDEEDEEEPSVTESGPYAIISHLSFETASLQPPDYNYSRALVIPRTSEEDIGWIDETFGDDPLLEKAIYTVDKPVEPYILPANKGHEVMAYLTFIIDFYDDLPDVSIFMHAHLISWHNNELLEMSSAKMIENLNLRKVVREGYINLRCHRYPSCPDHLFPIAKTSDAINIPEEQVFADAWKAILPHEEVPEVVSQPCCGQFAVSRERIRLLPREQYEHFRKWVMYTILEDRLSGRVWEYIYQYIWLGVAQLCPKEHICYCDTYGVCFGGETQYEDYYAKKAHVDVLVQMSKDEEAEGGNKMLLDDYEVLLERARAAVEDDLKNAMLRGADPYNRAMEVGRDWQEGDGF